jgi:cobyric acid synthase
VWGTYVHGLFESGAGAPAPASLDHRVLREAAYERLADTLAASIDPRLLRELGAS